MGDGVYVNASAGTAQVNIITAHPTLDATNGHFTLFQHAQVGTTNCGGANTCISWGRCFSNGNTDALSCNFVSVVSDPQTVFPNLKRTTLTDLPFHAWKRDEVLYVRRNDQTDGLGTWTESSSIRTPSGQDIILTITLTPFTNDGYGIFYLHRDKQGNSFTYEYTFVRTASSDGLTGWTGETIVYTGGSTQYGALGVDGTGRPYIASATGGNTIQVRRNANTAGSGSWTIVETITFSACTWARPDIDHMVILTDDTPAFLAYCQDGSLYFVRSTITSAEGPWTIQNILSGGAYIGANSAALSIDLSGNGAPHVAYLVQSSCGNFCTGYTLHVIQSTLQTSF